MKMNLKKLGVVLLTLVTFVAGCGQKNGTTDGPAFVKELLTKDKIIVGISPDYPPYEFREGNDIVGFDPDMINKVVEILNKKNGTDLKVELKAMDFGLIVGSLETKQVDLGVSGFTYDPDRNVAFSDTYVQSKQVVIVKDPNIKTIEDLKGKKIAAGQGSTGESAAKDIEGAEVSTPGDYTQMFAILNAGQIDAVVADEAVGDNYVREMGLIKLEESLIDEEMKIIMNKENQELLKAINEALAEFVASDDYKALQVKWKLIAGE